MADTPEPKTVREFRHELRKDAQKHWQKRVSWSTLDKNFAEMMIEARSDGRFAGYWMVGEQLQQQFFDSVRDAKKFLNQIRKDQRGS